MTTEPLSPAEHPRDTFTVALENLEIAAQSTDATILPPAAMKVHDALATAVALGRRLLPSDKFTTTNAIELANMLLAADADMRRPYGDPDDPDGDDPDNGEPIDDPSVPPAPPPSRRR